MADLEQNVACPYCREIVTPRTVRDGKSLTKYCPQCQRIISDVLIEVENG